LAKGKKKRTLFVHPFFIHTSKDFILTTAKRMGGTP
jgi:hypothetical protein